LNFPTTSTRALQLYEDILRLWKREEIEHTKTKCRSGLALAEAEERVEEASRRLSNLQTSVKNGVFVMKPKGFEQASALNKAGQVGAKPQDTGSSAGPVGRKQDDVKEEQNAGDREAK
jgi:hypothetical protein